MTVTRKSDGVRIEGEIQISGEINLQYAPICRGCKNIPYCILATRHEKDHVLAAPCGRPLGYLEGVKEKNIEGGFWVATDIESFNKACNSKPSRDLPEGYNVVVYRNTEEYHIDEGESDRE